MNCVKLSSFALATFGFLAQSVGTHSFMLPLLGAISCGFPQHFDKAVVLRWGQVMCLSKLLLWLSDFCPEFSFNLNFVCVRERVVTSC